MANERIVGLSALLVIGLGVIGYAAFAATLRNPAGNIDTPAPNQSISAFYTISGWALAPSGVSHVDIYINDVKQGSASYGTGGPRTDVCSSYQQNVDCVNRQGHVGWQFGLNTTGMGNGDYTLQAEIYGASGGTTNTPKQIFHIENTPPIGYIDAPASGGFVGNNMTPGSSLTTLSGWAVDSQTPISRVDLSIDALPFIYSAIYGANRPDVCAQHLGPGCNAVGWNYNLDTSNIPNGPHTLHMTAYDSDGIQRSVTIDQSFVVSNTGPAPVITGPGTTPAGGSGGGGSPTVSYHNPEGYIDDPAVAKQANLTVVKGNAYSFDGWAIDKDTAIQKIEVLVDGNVIGTPKPGGGPNVRKDVCNQGKQAYFNCPGGYIGWQLNYDTTKLTNGTHTIQIRVTDNDSPTRHISVTPSTAYKFKVNNVLPPGGVTANQPDVYIDNINDPGTNKTAVDGWVLDNNANASGSITKVVLVDVTNKKQIGNARLGILRTDVCLLHPGRPLCAFNQSNYAKVGWNLTFDSSGFPSGTNTLQVTATNSAGASRTISKSFLVNVTGGNGTKTKPPTIKDSCGYAYGKSPCPRGYIDVINDLNNISPANTSGTILVTGWALESSSNTASYPKKLKRQIDHVEIYIDKVDKAHDMGTAKYGYKNATKYFRFDECHGVGAGMAVTTIDTDQYPCPNIGWSYELKTKQQNISDGRHTLIAKVVGYQKSSSIELKQVFRVENNSGGGRVNIETQPVGFITSPQDFNWDTNSPIQTGTFKISGWAMDKDTPISEVDVTINGNGDYDTYKQTSGQFHIDMGQATLGKSTDPSVCAAHKGYIGCPGGNVGWEMAIDTTKLPKVHGLYTVTIRVVDSDTPTKHVSEKPQDSCDLSLYQYLIVNKNKKKCAVGYGNKSSNIPLYRSFRTNIPFSPPIKNIPIGTIDFPTVGTPTISGTRNFNGWGLDSSATPITAISRVTFSFDKDPTIYTADYGTGNPRTDVCAVYGGRPGCISGQPNYGYIGWQFNLDTSNISDGIHTVHVNIYDSDPTQNVYTIDRDFNVDNTPPKPTATNLKPDVYIENFNPSATTTSLSGWAIDNETEVESAVSSVSVYVDGNYSGDTSYGAKIASNQRNTVCQQFPGSVGCPYVGWSYTFDSSTLYNGSHAVKVIATDATGLTNSVEKDYTVTNNPQPNPPGNPPPQPPVATQTRSSADRPDDPSNGTAPQIHVVYMVPAGGRDRQLDINGRLDVFMNGINAWFSAQTGGRTLRFDTYGNGAHLDVTYVASPHPNSFYAPLGTQILPQMQIDNQAAGLSNPNKIYATFLESGTVWACGAAFVPGHYPFLSFFGSFPNGDQCLPYDINPASSSVEFFDFSMTHEIIHSLGAVQPCAPDFLSNFHTNEPADLMNGIPGGAASPSVVTLDPGKNDYYGPNVPVNCPSINGSPYIK